MVPRPRLCARLDPLLERGAAWISAPAGSGKTSLVSSWLAERKPRAIWYRLDAGDGDLATFFYYLGIAADVEGSNADPLPHLTPEYALGLPVFVARWFERFFARFDPPFVLVLDSIHEVPAGSRLHDALSGAIAQLPEGAGIVLISRNEPPAAYARWATSGQFVRIDWEDLRFTDKEAQAVASARGHADPEELAAVNAIARGWAAGLVLLLRARDEGLRLPEKSAEVPQAVFDYFDTEIFARLPPLLRNFLLQTAMLPVVVPEVAAALTGQQNAKEILFDLARQGFFTERRDSQEPAYAYHPLFREFLRDQACKTQTATQLHAVRCHTAKLLEQAGDIDGAAELLIVTKDWTELGRLCCVLNGEHCEARHRLLKVAQIADDMDSDIMRFYALMNLSYSWLETGEESAARDALRRALAIGRKQNYLNGHPPWIPKIMARVLGAALAYDIETEYVRRLIRHGKLRPEAGAVESWPWPIKIRVLGSFELLKDEASLPAGGKARHRPLELLKAVAALGGRKVAATKLIDALWPDAEGDAAQHAFDTTVYRLRKLLDQPDAIVVHDTKVSLNTECCWLDVWAFEELQARAEDLQHDGPKSKDLARIGAAALRLYRGDLLAQEAESPWLHAPRERLHGKFVRLVSAIGCHWEEAGQSDRAAELYQKALEIDPLTETWYRRLMVCHQHHNGPAEALAVYQRCQKILSEVLRCQPSIETEAVYRALKQG